VHVKAACLHTRYGTHSTWQSISSAPVHLECLCHNQLQGGENAQGEVPIARAPDLDILPNFFQFGRLRRPILPDRTSQTCNLTHATSNRTS